MKREEHFRQSHIVGTYLRVPLIGKPIRIGLSVETHELLIVNGAQGSSTVEFHCRLHRAERLPRSPISDPLVIVQ